MRWALAGLLFLVIAWYASIQPSHDREWRPEVAVMPRAMIDGDRVRITGVRHFDFRTRDDFTIRHEEREVLLSHLTSVDFYISYWAEGPVGHTFLSFNFDNADPVCISIETRPEVGEGFAPVASMFKQFELIYVVGDERDLVRLRTNFRDEEVFLYRIRTTRERRTISSRSIWIGSTHWPISQSSIICSATAAPSILFGTQTRLDGRAASISATCLTALSTIIFFGLA